MNELEEWVAELGQALGLEPGDVVIDELLDLAKEAAHTVARPAAPITTFVVGYVAGRRGGGRETIAQTVQEALALIAARGRRFSGGSDPENGSKPPLNR